LIKASDEEPTRKYDPWELVTEAVQRMKRNNDVMRSDRLKQVMQEIDSTFDEKNLGISKFSRFCQEAAQRGLLSVTKLDNGQLEVDLPSAAPAAETRTNRTDAPATEASEVVASGEERGPRRSRRGRGGGRGREREPRVVTPTPATAATASVEGAPPAPIPAIEPAAQLEFAAAARPSAEGAAGSGGERLTRSEAFDLVRRAVNELVAGDESIRASEVRMRARQLLGRDSESLSDRMFVRILKDAHDEGIIDLRRRGNDFEVARAAEAAPVSEQLSRHETAATAPSASAGTPAGPRLGMGPRGARARGAGPLRGRPGAPPPELLSIGVVEHVPAAVAAPREVPPTPTDNGVVPETRAKRGRSSRGRGKTGRQTPAAGAVAIAAKAPVVAAASAPPPKAKRGRVAAKAPAGRSRAKKHAPAADEE
jgi:hypothetical protein